MTPPFQRFHIRFIEKTLSRTKCEQFSRTGIWDIKKHGHISYVSFVFECTLASNLTIKCSSSQKIVPIVDIHYLETGSLTFNRINGTQQFVSVD